MDLSRIDRVEERRRIAELSRQREDLEDNKYEASAEVRRRMQEVTEPLWVPFRKQITDAEAPFREEIARLEAEWESKIEAIDAEMETLPALQYDEEYTDTFKCELTGLLILEGDEFIRDEDTGECFLRAAMPERAPDPSQGEDTK